MANPKVRFETTMGNFTAEIYEDKAPASAKNFLQYVRDGFYNGTIFHRVIPGFVIQGGGMEPGMKEKKTRPPVKLEVANKLKHEDGSLSMARTMDPDSGTSQFFVCDGPQRGLDSKGPRDGYAVFGKVMEGMDVVRKIVRVPTASKGHHDDVPKQDVVVTRASVA
jgi:cyclophilin family peptidyl-prolyl cis-trans isomerase